MILLRHAKSSWDDPALEDHDRPLNARGRQAAPVIGAWLAARGHVPDCVLCSSSRRTRETLERMVETLPDLPGAEIETGLYHAAPAHILGRLARLPDTVRAPMVIGHQPGLGSFARRMARAPVRPRCARAFEHFPTAAAAVLTLDIADWSDLAFGQASFVDFAKPRELVRT